MVEVVCSPIMRVEIRCRGMMSLEEMREFVVSAEPLEFRGTTREEKYRWIERTLNRQKYLKLTKREKGIVRAYMEKMTGFSSSHLTRLICRYRWTGRVKGISVSHLYNLRKTRSYHRQTTFFQKTKPTSVNIGERRKPDPQGRPGYLRVDTVHQGNKNGTKGVYHLNTIDEVTQWPVRVGCTEKISERYLKPLLIALIDQYPFRVRGFHADNGSEHINKVVAKLLNKLLIELTKSRARKTNDNALVEGKNGSIVRKYMGYGHIPQKMAERIDRFYREYFTPYLNYHRPCGYARREVDKKGKERKKYDTYMTPYEKLRSLPGVEKYLKPGVTLAKLDEIAYSCSDVECACMMQREKSKIFQRLMTNPRVRTAQPQEALSCSSFD
jgi:transposase InsO family protein